MGAFLGWAAFAIRHRKQDSRVVEDLETKTRDFANSRQAANDARNCQEAVARMLKEQLITLRATMAAHSEASSSLQGQERMLQAKYDEAKRELRRLEHKRLRAEKQFRAYRQRLNDVIVDLEDERRRRTSSRRGAVDNSWLTNTC